MNSFYRAFMVLGGISFVGLSSSSWAQTRSSPFVQVEKALQGRNIRLVPKAGEAFKDSGARTLQKADGSVLVAFDSFEFANGTYTLRGRWAGVAFSSQYTLGANRSGLMEFSFPVIQEAFPCSSVHQETVSLVLIPKGEAGAEVSHARVDIERTEDDCHLSRELTQVNLEQSQIDFVLKPAAGEDFSKLGASSLERDTGLARIDLVEIKFDGNRSLLRGVWNGIVFESIAVVPERSGAVEFWFELVRRESPCGEGHYETATLKLIDDSRLGLRVVSAELSVKTTPDSCHLSPQGPKISMVAL